MNLLAAVKLEDSPAPAKMAALRAAVGGRLKTFGGLGGVGYLHELGSGADGMMTGYGYPEHLVSIFQRFRAGDVAGATDTYTRWLPIMRQEAQPGIGSPCARRFCGGEVSSRALPTEPRLPPSTIASGKTCTTSSTAPACRRGESAPGTRPGPATN